MIDLLKRWARRLKSNLSVLYFAYRDPAAPWHAKLAALCVVAYAFSPIDLIPDFIPILGYLDDLVVVPLGILLAVRLMPPEVIESSRLKAQSLAAKPKNWYMAALFMLVWLLAGIWIAYLIYGAFRNH